MTQGGAGLGTQTDVMAQAAQQVATVRSDIDAQLGALRTRLQAVPDIWQGSAGSAFVTAMARAEEDSRKLATALGLIGDQLRASGTAYDAVEAEQRDRVLREVGNASSGSGISDALRG